MQQYVDDAMPASDHVCYMLLLLLFRKEKTNPNNLSQTDCLLICQRMQSKRKQQEYLINARLPAKLNNVYFHSKSIEISRNSNEIFFVCFFKTVLVHTDLIVISQTEISERRRRRRASHGQNNNNANGARPGCRESEEAKKPSSPS